MAQYGGRSGMKKPVPAAPESTEAIVAEVIAEGMPLRRPNRVEIQVRLTGEELRVGPARLVSASGRVHDVNILGAYFYDGRPPEMIDPLISWIGVEGLTSADIEPGQLILQAARDGAAIRSRVR